MEKPTQKQIDAEVKALEALKPLVPHYTFFGDNNWDCITAEIRVLKRETVADAVAGYASDSAYRAQRWLEGEKEEPPSQGWQSLAGKKPKPAPERKTVQTKRKPQSTKRPKRAKEQ